MTENPPENTDNGGSNEVSPLAGLSELLEAVNVSPDLFFREVRELFGPNLENLRAAGEIFYGVEVGSHVSEDLVGQVLGSGVSHDKLVTRRKVSVARRKEQVKKRQPGVINTDNLALSVFTEPLMRHCILSKLNLYSRDGAVALLSFVSLGFISHEEATELYLDKLYHNYLYDQVDASVNAFRYLLDDEMSVNKMRHLLEVGMEIWLVHPGCHDMFHERGNTPSRKWALDESYNTKAKIRARFSYLFDWPVPWVKMILSANHVRKAVRDGKVSDKAEFLCVACQAGMKDEVLTLLEKHGANPYADATCRRGILRFTPLGWSLIGGHTAIAKILVFEFGVDPTRALHAHQVLSTVDDSEVTPNGYRVTDRPPPLQFIVSNIGDADVVSFMIDKLKLPVNEPDSHGCTALIRAALKRSGPMVQALLARGADVNARFTNELQVEMTPLLSFIQSVPEGNYQFSEEVLRMLCSAPGVELDACTADGLNPLMVACITETLTENERLVVLRTLIEHGADVTAKCQVNSPPRKLNCLQYLCHRIASQTDVVLAKFLIDNMPNNRLGDEAYCPAPLSDAPTLLPTAFELCVMGALSFMREPNASNNAKRLEVMRYIHAKMGGSGNPAIREHSLINLQGHDALWQLPVYLAQVANTDAARGWIPILVKEFGFDPYSMPPSPDGNGVNILHMAATKDQVKLAKLLLDECGMDVECTTGWGWTPLHVCAAHNSHKVANLLMKRGANVKARTKAAPSQPEFHQKTPLELARVYGKPNTLVARAISKFISAAASRPRCGS